MPFKSVEDRRAYRKLYFQKNKEKFNANSRNWHSKNRDRSKVNKKAWKETSFRNFLMSVLSRIKVKFIDLDYVLGLLEKQKFCCAVTGVPLVHRMYSVQSVSIDRIDSSLGYVDGNVQLVCKFVNLGKGEHSNVEVKEFFELFYGTRDVVFPCINVYCDKEII